MGKEDYARSEVRIPWELNDKVRKYVLENGFKSVSQFVIYLIEKELNKKD